MRKCLCGCGRDLGSNPRQIGATVACIKRMQRQKHRDHVAGGAAPVLPPPAPLRPPSTDPSISTGRSNEPTPDKLTIAHASSLAIFRNLPYVESVTIHRDGYLSIIRAGPPGEPVQDVLCDLASMAGGAGAPSFEVT